MSKNFALTPPKSVPTKSVPTNAYAAKRPYCKKHSRALLDIGGKLQCAKCEEEKRCAPTTKKAE